jgi:hypothetical protein
VQNFIKLSGVASPVVEQRENGKGVLVFQFCFEPDSTIMVKVSNQQFLRRDWYLWESRSLHKNCVIGLV